MSAFLIVAALSFSPRLEPALKSARASPRSATLVAQAAPPAGLIALPPAGYEGAVVAGVK